MTKIRLSYITFVFLAILCGNNSVLATQNHFDPKNISILVSSCDKYSQLWGPFFNGLEKNWPELNSTQRDLKIYLIANTKQFPSERVETINIPQEISWSDNMLTALDKIDTKYVLLFLDDYWVDRKIEQPRLLEIMQIMHQEDAAYMQLYADGENVSVDKQVKNVEGIVYKNKFQNFRTSLQLGLWETKALKQILRSGESAWDFEIAASIRSSGYPKPFLSLKTNPPIVYINAAHRGHIDPRALEFAKAHDPSFVNTNTMPVLQKYNWKLFVAGIKHRVEVVTALVKRNLFKERTESYRYKFDDRS